MTFSTTKAYTTALAGDPESSSVGLLTAALANAVGAFGRVAAGDYLDRKNLADKTKAFHIGCYRREALIDLITCPLTLRNAGIALAQADRIVWVIRPDSLTDNLKLALAASASFGARSHVIALNAGGLPADLASDPDLIQVMEAEIRELFETHEVPVDFAVNVSMGGPQDMTDSADTVSGLASYLFDQWLEPAHRSEALTGSTYVGVEQCYGVSSPAGKPVRVGYGPVRGRSVSLGQTLTLLGAGGGREQVRVAELQEFGESVTEAVCGSSAAILLHGAPKDRPKSGEWLTDHPENFFEGDQISVDSSVLQGQSSADTLASLNGLDLCVGLTSLPCKIIDFAQDDRYPQRGHLRLRSSVNLAAFAGEPVIFGHGQTILGWGQVLGDSGNE
jgi:hypothetical protein